MTASLANLHTACRVPLRWRAGDPLICPRCRASLKLDESGASCTACSQHWKSIDGFLDLILGERFDDSSSTELLNYEELSNRDLTLKYWIPLFRRLQAGRERPLRLLSVGCGTGVDVDVLCAAGFECCGIDCGNRCSVWPRRVRADRLLLANGKHLPFPDQAFDAVFCGCVFPHVGVIGDSSIVRADVAAERTMLANEMVRVLDVGGDIVVSSPNRWFPFDIFHGRAPGSYRPRWNPPTSRFLLSRADYDRLFRAAGCGVARVLPVENYWSFLRSRHSLRGWFLGLPVRTAFWLVSRSALAFLRTSPINPWLVVTARKLAVSQSAHSEGKRV